MNPRTKTLLIALGAALLLPRCILIDQHLGRGHSGVKVKECHPSQYWDGTQCRHKGNGNGARKHDD